MFKGLGTALITPFKSNGDIDFNALSDLVNSQIKGGVDTLVVMGTTGESAVLTKDEKRAVLDHVLEVNAGKLKVVYGIGGNNTRSVVDEIRSFDMGGVDGILSVSPYYNKPTQQGIVEHYKMIDGATNKPVIIYNVPGRTSSNLTAETILELAELPNMCAVKEASGNMEQIMEVIRNRPDNFLVLSGDDAITLPIMAVGGDGVISVVSNAYPSEFSKMVRACLKQDYELANQYHYLLLPQIQNLFKEGNPGGVKEITQELGLGSNVMRMPLVNVSPELRKELLAEHDRIKNA